jgi:hypothetical protein
MLDGRQFSPASCRSPSDGLLLTAYCIMATAYSARVWLRFAKNHVERPRADCSVIGVQGRASAIGFVWRILGSARRASKSSRGQIGFVWRISTSSAADADPVFGAYDPTSLDSVGRAARLESASPFLRQEHALLTGIHVPTTASPATTVPPRGATGSSARVSFLRLFALKVCKTVSFFTSFHQGAKQAGILFLVSIERGISRRVYHRRPWLSDMSQLGNVPCRFLARPGCGARPCVGPARARPLLPQKNTGRAPHISDKCQARLALNAAQRRRRRHPGQYPTRHQSLMRNGADARSASSFKPDKRLLGVFWALQRHAALRSSTSVQ